MGILTLTIVMIVVGICLIAMGKDQRAQKKERVHVYNPWWMKERR